MDARARCRRCAEFGTVSVDAVDADESDDYFMAVTDFVTPTRLFLGTAGRPRAGAAEAAARVFRRQGPRDHASTKPFPRTGRGSRTSRSRARTSRATAGIRRFSTATADSRSRWFRSTAAPSARAGSKKAASTCSPTFAAAASSGRSGTSAALKANRHKAFEDFIAVAEDLVRRKVTSPAHLGIQGGSNGGLLMGNMLTLRPDLFGAVVCQVPLLDMRRYHVLLAGASWMDEYGDPDDPDEWAFIRTFSPYHNVRDGVKLSAHALHDLDARRPRASRRTRARWRRGCGRRGRTSSTTRTSKAATAARRTTASSRTWARSPTRSSGRSCGDSRNQTQIAATTASSGSIRRDAHAK